MTELAARDGLPPPEGLPDGECILTTSADGGIHVDRADPRILISAEWFEKCRPSPAVEVTVDLGHDAIYECFPPVEGALLKIHGINRTVVYRITEYVPRIRGYIAEWPD